MIATIRLSAIGVRQLRQAVDAFLHRSDPANVAPELRDVAELLRAEDIGAHSTPEGGQLLVDGTLLLETLTMSYREAAGALGVSTRTIGRRVASGHLETVGRRVTTASLAALTARTAA